MNEITTRKDDLPAHLGEGKTARFGNVDASDIIIPRIKLLQPLNPEVEEFDNAEPGNFWHTVRQQNLGDSLIGVPINVRKSFVLWAPRGDDRGILARATDAIHWDPPEGEFKVKFKQDPATYTWTLKKTVAESRLGEFGTSRPGDPQSIPAAAKTYEFLWYFPELGGCALMINARGSIKAGQSLISMIDDRPRDHFLQIYRIGVKRETSKAGDSYHNYTYTGVGYVDEATAEITRSLYSRYANLTYRANDETDDVESAPTGPRPSQDDLDANSKF